MPKKEVRCEECGKIMKGESGKDIQEAVFAHAKETGHKGYTRKVVE